MRNPAMFLILALAACGGAAAGEGPCGLETGVWAFRRDACRYADPRVYDARYAEFERKFGDAEGIVFLWIEKGRITLHQESGACQVRSATLAGKECRITLACRGEPAFTEILAVSSARAFTRPFPAWLKDPELRRRHPTISYAYCGRSG
jgi:hypothetical protein